MARFLFIAIPDPLSQTLSGALSKIGHEVVFAKEADTQKILAQGEFERVLLEPFHHFRFSANLIRQFHKEQKSDRVFLVLPGTRAHEELTAKNIVGDHYFSASEPLEIILTKILGFPQTIETPVPPPTTFHNPVNHYMKSEIEKAKRSNTSLSLLYLKLLKAAEQEKKLNPILQKINDALHLRLRISDEAFPYHGGILILLFGTHAQDRSHVLITIKKIAEEVLRSYKISFDSMFETREATYPDDGKSYIEIVHILENYPASSLPTTATKISKSITELLTQTELPKETFRLKRKLWEIEANEGNSYIAMSCLPPTWFGALNLICNDTRSSPNSIEEFIKNETNIGDRLLTFITNLISLFPEVYNSKKTSPPSNITEAFQFLDADSVKNLICLTTLEKIILNDPALDTTFLKQTQLQMMVGLALSKKIDYANKPELLLCIFSQMMGAILIKRKKAEVFSALYEKQKKTKLPLGKLCFDQIQLTPSELTSLFLKRWGMDEAIIESASCARYEFLPQYNPQLTALTHISIVLSNHLPGTLYEHNCKVSKTAIDEIMLRNRNLNFETLQFIFDDFHSWKSDYSFISIS